MDNLYESLGSKTALYDDKEKTLMARWRYPSLSVHGIEGAFSAPGAKTVIPAKVIGKFSIRTVPNMEIEEVNKLVYKYVKEEFAKLKSKNTMDVSLQHAGKWWAASPKNWNFSAASKAVERVFGVKPDFTREGGRYAVSVNLSHRSDTDYVTVYPSPSHSSKQRERRSSCCRWGARRTQHIPSTRSSTRGTTLKGSSC